MNLLPFLFLMLGQQVTVPPEIHGLPGSFISIPAVTDCKTLQWVVLDQGLNMFPVELLRDTTVGVVSTITPGKYRVLVYGAKDGIPSKPAITLVIVGNPAPEPEPQPTPPDVSTKLIRDLKSIYSALNEPDKDKNVIKLAGVYKTLSATVLTPEINTAGELWTEAKLLTSMFLTQINLQEIRSRLQSEMSWFPVEPEEKLTVELKSKISLKFKEISTALERITSATK